MVSSIKNGGLIERCPCAERLFLRGAQFLRVLGGDTPKRNALPVKLAKVGSDETGKYGDPVGKRIIGVEADSIILPTRIHQWKIMAIREVTNRLLETVFSETSGEAPGRICGEDALEFCQ